MSEPTPIDPTLIVARLVYLDADGFVERVHLATQDEFGYLQNAPRPYIEVSEAQAAVLLATSGGRMKHLSGTDFTFIPDAATKPVKWFMLKQQRDAAEHAGFVWDGSTFDSDPVSQSRIQGASQLAQIALGSGEPFSIDWTLADNSVRTLDAMQMIAVGVAMGVHITTQHAKGRVLRGMLDAATTPEEVIQITWDSV